MYKKFIINMDIEQKQCIFFKDFIDSHDKLTCEEKRIMVDHMSKYDIIVTWLLRKKIGYGTRLNDILHFIFQTEQANGFEFLLLICKKFLISQYNVNTASPEFLRQVFDNLIKDTEKKKDKNDYTKCAKILLKTVPVVDRVFSQEDGFACYKCVIPRIVSLKKNSLDIVKMFIVEINNRFSSRDKLLLVLGILNGSLIKEKNIPQIQAIFDQLAIDNINQRIIINELLFTLNGIYTALSRKTPTVLFMNKEDKMQIISLIDLRPDDIKITSTVSFSTETQTVALYPLSFISIENLCFVDKEFRAQALEKFRLNKNKLKLLSKHNINHLKSLANLMPILSKYDTIQSHRVANDARKKLIYKSEYLLYSYIYNDIQDEMHFDKKDIS